MGALVPKQRGLPFWLMQAESCAYVSMAQDNLGDRMDFLVADINRVRCQLYCHEADCFHWPKKREVA